MTLLFLYCRNYPIDSKFKKTKNLRRRSCYYSTKKTQ